jgi:hypothetical protein
MTMLWAQFSLNTIIWWHTIVRHSQIFSGNTPPMTRKCIPLYKAIVNGNITFWEKRQSYTSITSLCSSYKHMRNCRMIAIISGPPTCNRSISKSTIRNVSQIMSLTSSVGLLWMHSPLCSIHVDMKHLSVPKFISNIQTSPPPISSWVHVRLSSIFTFRKNSYSTWSISMFL